MSYDIKDILKKFWFVILVGAIFVSFAIFFAWDTNKDTIGAKSSKGKDVIFTLANKNYTADTFYTDLFETTASGGTAKSGVQLAYTLLERSVVDQSVKTTDEMEKDFENFENFYKQEYGDEYEARLTPQLQQLGYDGIDDLKLLFLNQEKSSKLISDYLNEHQELFDEVYEKESPRVISHILVKMADSENPSDTEKARMEEVDKALEDESFGKVAKKYSDDTGSAEQNGSLGIQLKNKSLEEAFENAAWNLKDGEVSGWIKTSYGYHLIKIETSSKEKMLEEDKYQNSLFAVILNHYPNLKKQIIWGKAQELGVKIKDKDLEADLLKYIGVDEKKMEE